MLGTNYTSRTAAVFRLSQLTGLPLEPLPDIVPGIGPLRWTADVVTSETTSYNWTTVDHAVEDLSNITSHVKRELREVSLVCLLADNPKGAIGSPANRLDIMRRDHLVSMSDLRQVVMVATPRVVLRTAFITSVSDSWSPDNGYSTVVSVTFKEANVVNSLTGVLYPDWEALGPGANSSQSGGQQSAQATNLTSTPPAAITLAPFVA